MKSQNKLFASLMACLALFFSCNPASDGFGAPVGSTVAITLTISTSEPSILLANTAAATNTIDVVVPVPNNTLYLSGTVTGGGQPITYTNGTVKQLWWRVPFTASV